MRKGFALTGLLATLMLLLSVVPALAQDDTEDGDPGVLNIYSSRHYGALEQPFVAFQEETGIEVRVSSGTPRDLLGRLQADIERGDRSVADVFLAIDAGVLSLATERGLMQPLSEDDAPAVYENVPESQRDPEGHWFGLSQRIRTVVYNPENVSEEEANNLTQYRDLANDTWEGRVCMRPASHIYTVSLFSSLLHHYGEEEASTIAGNIADNVTRYINSDTSQIRTVAAGECDVAFVNHYYMGRLAASEDPEDTETFEAVELKWMNQGADGRGVFYNTTAAGIVTNARNYDNAMRFLEFMTSEQGQAGDEVGFPGSNYEYPVNPDVEPHPIIQDFGEVKLDTNYPLWEYGDLQGDTVEMLESVDFGFTEN